MDRVLIAGISGSGKTTLAKTLQRRLGLPHFELDALYHGSGWVRRADFESEVDEFSAASRWVTEDSYHSALGDALWERADTLIWLDFPRRTVMRRVLCRSFARAATLRELWNGNREGFRAWADPGHPIRWAWSQHSRKHRDCLQRIRRHPRLTVIRLCSAREADHWLSGLTSRR